MKFLRIILLLFPLFFGKIEGTVAQVTLGSTLKPSPGALLDLKEENGTATAAKGLCLPRVALTSRYNLTPMFTQAKNSPSDILDFTSYADANKAEEDVKHIGLVVFNITNAKGFCPGLYVWDGNQWQAVGFTDYPPSTVADNDGNVYPTHWYGTCEDGSYWMTENLRTTRYPDGNLIPIGYDQRVGDNHITYPYQSYRTGDNGSDRSTYDLLPTMGFLYTQTAALAEESPSTAPTYALKRGICPEGWFLPVAPKISELLAVLKANPLLYSSLTPTELLWADSKKWATMIGSTQPLPNINAAVGKSFPSREGGFNMHATGFYFRYGGWNGSEAYGTRGYIWTSGVSGGMSQSFDWAVNTSVTTPVTTHNAPNALPVRCFKPKE